jgi:hypothetical protein
MNRRLWLVAAVLAMIVAGCGGGEAGTKQLAGELAETKVDRDRLALEARRLGTAAATLEANTVVDRNRCLGTLDVVRQRMESARAALKAGKDAAVDLDRATKRLDDALDGDCAPP